MSDKGAYAMRVGQLTDIYKPFINGVTNFVSLHKHVLESWGHKVFVFTPGYEDYEDDELNVIRSPAIPLSDTGYQLNLSLSRRARRKIVTMDVLHVHHPFINAQQAMSLAKRHDIPVVFTNHTRYQLVTRYYLPLALEGLSRTFIETYLPHFAEQCDLVVAPSRGIKRTLEEIGVTRPIEVIPNGVDVARLQNPSAPLSKHDLGLPERAIAAITVGRLGPEKNLPFMLQAFNRAATKVDDLHLVIIGKGREEGYLEEMVRMLGMTARVHLVGEVPYDEVPNWLALGDFFVITSVSESHPLSMLEALAAGLPAVGILGPGVEDTIVDGVNGLSSLEDVDAFAAQIQRLAMQPDLRARLAAGARETSSQYDIHNTSRRLLAHYERLIEECARRERERRDT
jgi:glycosyltransferase involved in cell wall biosynthesis